MAEEKVVHTGGCHCRQVRWRVRAPQQVVVWDCNCSNCAMRRNTHFIVPSADFEIDDSYRDFLTLYTFGSHQAKHLFCKICGICSYYIPRSNPDGVAVTLNCVDPGTITHVEVRKFNGQKWEDSHRSSGISALSKPSNESSGD